MKNKIIAEIKSITWKELFIYIVLTPIIFLPIDWLLDASKMPFYEFRQYLFMGEQYSKFQEVMKGEDSFPVIIREFKKRSKITEEEFFHIQEKEVEYLKKLHDLAEEKFPLAYFELAKVYSMGLLNLKTDNVECKKWMDRAFNAGHPLADPAWC